MLIKHKFPLHGVGVMLDLSEWGGLRAATDVIVREGMQKAWDDASNLGEGFIWVSTLAYDECIGMVQNYLASVDTDAATGTVPLVRVFAGEHSPPLRAVVQLIWNAVYVPGQVGLSVRFGYTQDV